MIPFVKAEWGGARRGGDCFTSHLMRGHGPIGLGVTFLEGIRSLPVESRVASPTWECG
jgi:hypothetical protein